MLYNSTSNNSNLSEILNKTWICPECKQVLKINSNGIEHYCNNSLKLISLDEFQKYYNGNPYTQLQAKTINMDKYFSKILIEKINEIQKYYNPTNQPFKLKEDVNVIEGTASVELVHGHIIIPIC